MLRDIYERWILDPALVAAVPAERVVVGWFLDEPSQFPYVAIEDAGDSVSEYTSSANVYEDRAIRFHIFHDDLHSLVNVILPAIRAEYNRISFAASRGTVVNIQWQSDITQYMPDGTYHVISTYTATIAVGVGE